MRRGIFCCLVSVLVLTVLLLQGCGKGGSRKQDSTTSGGSSVTEKTSDAMGTSVAMGRFVEAKIELPVSINVLFDLRCGKDDVIWVLFEDKPRSLYLYESTDGGENWNGRKLGMDWLPKDYRVGAACVDMKGNIFACAGKMSDDSMAKKHVSGIYRYFRIGQSGDVKEISLELPKPKEEYSVTAYGISKPAMSENGKLYGMLDLTSEKGKRRGQLFCFDMKSGKKLWSTDVDDTGMRLFGDQLYVYIGDKKMLKHMDGETGKELEETECPYDLESLDMKSEKNKIYGIDTTGIYGTDSQIKVRELLVDGALGSFSDEDCTSNRLVSVSEDVFLLVLVNSAGEKTLFRYKYDPDIPTRPDNELTVYTLKNNVIMKMLVSDFRKEHPEIYVRYEVGLDGSSVKNTSDAINALNTEILAGNGPDILVLNNLPWESYMEKGMLANLAGCYEKDEVFGNLFQPYEREGENCVVPLAFKIPVAVGNKAVVSAVDSAEELLKRAETTKSDYLPFLMGKQELVRYMFSIYWQTLQTGDGSLSRENVRRMLEIIKKIREHVDASTSEWNDVVFGTDEDRTLDYFGKSFELDNEDVAAMSLTYLDGTNSLIYSYNQMKKKTSYDDMSWQAISRGTFSPLLAGASSKSERIEISKSFIRFCLGAKEQGRFDNPGRVFYQFPVNKKAWESAIQEPSKSEQEKRFPSSYEWPPQEVFADVERQIAGLKVPAMEDSTVIDTVLDSAVPYLAGTKNLDTAVDEIMQTLELYYAE